jgi:hypothetical protein
MIRRYLYTAAVIAFAGVSMWAAEEATFVLNNGQWHSGTLVYGRGSNNIVDGRFHLNSSGIDKTFGLDDVAVIDFAGGTPTAGERQALPPGNTGLMVMRNGSVQRGHLHNMMGGDVVQWVNEAGQRNNYPIRDVSRLYLNPESARRVFVDSPRQPSIADTAAPDKIRVDATQRWVETGIVVRRGDRLVFTAMGDITLAPGVSSGVNGTSAFKSDSYPVTAAAAGALIGKAGSTAFVIGSNTQPIDMPSDGRLMLGVNDDNFVDNTGFFSVVITRQTRRGVFQR